ncbi:unknow (plasmid) [Vibrio campbellii]|nr:unknow [Vibrio campbellii]
MRVDDLYACRVQLHPKHRLPDFVVMSYGEASEALWQYTAWQILSPTIQHDTYVLAAWWMYKGCQLIAHFGDKSHEESFTFYRDVMASAAMVGPS